MQKEPIINKSKRKGNQWEQKCIYESTKKIRQICLSNWNGLLSTKTEWKTYGDFTPTDSTTMLSLLWPYLPITIEKRACERDQPIQWFLGRDLLDRVSISLTKLFFSEPNSVCLLSKIVLERSRWIITLLSYVTSYEPHTKESATYSRSKRI